MNLIVGIILVCIGIIWLIISSREIYKINKKNNGIPVENGIAGILFFIFPSFMLIIGGFVGIMIHIYN